MSAKRVSIAGIIICAIAAFFYCYEYMLRIIPGVLQTQLRVAFGNIPATSFGTLSAYYYFAYSPMQLPVGLLMDRFGPRKLLIFACFICTIGSAMFAYTASFTLVSLGRFLVGFGSAFAFVGVLFLANCWLPARFFSLVAGVVTALGMLGAIIGEVGITVIVHHFGWQAILYGSAVIGAVLTIMIILFLHDHSEQVPEGNLPLKIFWHDVCNVLCSSQVWLVGIIGSLFYLSLSVFAEIWGKSYLIVAYGLSPIDAASCVSLVFLGWALGAPLSGFLSDWLGYRIVPLLVGAIFGAVCIGILLYSDALSLIAICSLLFMYGVCCSVEVIIFVIAKENCHSKLTGTVFACVNMIVMLSGVIFQPLVGYLLDSVWQGKIFNHVRIYSKLDNQLVLSILPLALVFAAILTFFVKEKNGYGRAP